ncbi:MAG: MiaB/RimO family radical SAM methylthiotransferase [Atopobiaceae bacterium]|nr:MiaB/RimO family radical SAM methylthiotransferase [Atopobiaceae bacterium]
MTSGTDATQRPAVALLNLGCRVNRVELDDIALELEALGCRIVKPEEASLIVVNTCAVTGEAEKKCRKAIRRASSLPHKPTVLSCGCMAALFADTTANLAENVLVEIDKTKVPARCRELLGIPDETATALTLPHEAHDAVTPTGRTRPGIKIQDGCNNRCSFCIVWKARGSSRSLEPEQVLERVVQAQERGAQEVVLTGINLGHYQARSSDGSSRDLAALVRLILDKTDIGRVRLSSVEPPECTEDLVQAMADGGERVAAFLHLPLQAGCDTTLERMRRLYRVADYERVVDTIRTHIPDLALACDLIVGFPGESDADFEESRRFCEHMNFANMHIFRYSSRPGTWAATAPNQVSPQLLDERSQMMHELARRSRQNYVSSRVGVEELVCVERRGRASTGGLIETLVDDSLSVGSLVRVTPHTSVNSGLVLDARSTGTQSGVSSETADGR